MAIQEGNAKELIPSGEAPMEATKKRERRRREESKEETSPETVELHPEIIREILLRLPAKSIGRFRCVSKLFRSLSSEPGFAKSHLDITTRNDSVHRKLIVSSQKLYTLDLGEEGCGGVRNVEAVSVFDEMVKSHWRKDVPAAVVVDVDDRYLKFILEIQSLRITWLQIIGSSKGLVCISPWVGALLLYNPTTKEFKRLPELTVEQRFQTHGFGFDDLNDDYKVVKIVADNDRVINASVYSLKADSWRRVCDLDFGYKDGGFFPGVNVNGAVHWLFSLRGGECNKRVVLAFDFTTEEFREMPLPVKAQEDYHLDNKYVVGNFSGRLCVVNICNEMDNDIWVMNEYGVASSWSRIRISLVCRSMRLVCSTKNNKEVLMEVDGDMVLYNFETSGSRNLGIRRDDFKFQADTYVESLVSPNSYGAEN